MSAFAAQTGMEIYLKHQLMTRTEYVLLLPGSTVTLQVTLAGYQQVCCEDWLQQRPLPAPVPQVGLPGRVSQLCLPGGHFPAEDRGGGDSVAEAAAAHPRIIRGV